LVEPASQGGQRLVFNNSRGQRFGPNGKTIRDPAGGGDELKSLPESGGSDIERVIDQQTTRPTSGLSRKSSVCVNPSEFAK